MNTEIFVVFKVYRQKEGEYYAVETEAAFPTKLAAEEFLKDKQSQWSEVKNVPVNTGGTMPVEFVGIRSVHATELRGA